MEQMSEGQPVRWGILSAANIGVSSVGPAILAAENAELVVVGSNYARSAAEKYAFAPNVRIERSYQKVIDDPEIEAVYVPLPNGLHAEWAIKAMEAGKHVLCEKPMAATREEGEMIADAAQAHNVRLMEAFMYRFHPQTQWVIEQIRQGLIGQLRLVRSSFTINILSRPDDIRFKPELAGGSLMDVGCYPLNLCRAVFGRTPESVVARVHTRGVTSVDYSTSAILDYGEGCFGLIDSSFEMLQRQGAEIVGERGIITIPVPFTPGGNEMTVFVFSDGQIREQSFSAIDQYRLQVEHFSHCVRTGEEPQLSVGETLENLGTIEAIYAAGGLDWPIV
jgi:D-xylose 1-dehydrogenase (NADP+, D-xylono-1,5-lactone-forming)